MNNTLNKIALTIFLFLILAVAGISTASADTFTVTTTADGASNDADDICTLREAITEANGGVAEDACRTSVSGGTDIIEFAIGAAGSPQTINIGSALPAINDPVILDGTTQSGMAGCDQITTPLIEISGPGISNVDPSIDGLRVNAGGSGSTIRGFVVNNFRRRGIFLNSSSNSFIQCNFVGTDVSGTLPLGNGQSGVRIEGNANNNIIGTDGDGANDAVEGNLISANGIHGITLINGAANNFVAGNLVGTDVTGTLYLANNTNGITFALGANNNLAGTNSDGVSDILERNIIVGGGFRGVEFVGNATTANNIVAGNYIGTDITGTFALGNTVGVGFRSGVSNNILGTDGDGVNDAIEGNLISGNRLHGVQISDAGTSGNIVAGNYIGPDVSGITTPCLDALCNTRRGNGQSGVLINNGASDNWIGTNGDGVSDALERNIISGNNQMGVQISGAATNSNTVAGNYIGTNAAGTGAVANNSDGVRIDGNTDANIIGTDSDGVSDNLEGNLISGNGDDGVEISGNGTTLNVVAGNLIGTNFDGTLPLGNRAALRIDSATDNRIGTNGDGFADDLERNIMSDSAVSAVAIRLSATRNLIAGNYIGTDASGLNAMQNRDHGIYVSYSSFGNIIGYDGLGDPDAMRNVISGNRNYAVYFDRTTNNNRVSGNYLGLDKTGATSLGNGTGGVFLGGGANNNFIGTNGDGTGDADEGNVISGNGGSGVQINGATGIQNVVAGNFIGTDYTGTLDRGNGSDGVLLNGSANHNIIGTNGDGVSDDLEGNIISGNNRIGIMMWPASSNTVAGNFIGTDVTGTVDLGNTRMGIWMWRGSPDNTIGTNGDGVSDELEGNLISGNDEWGVYVADNGTDRNTIAGNIIGMDSTGTAPLGNNGIALYLDFGPSFNTIGTNGDGVSDDLEGNLISANGGAGIILEDGITDYNVIAGNIVGLDGTGSVAMGNNIGIWFNIATHHNRIGTNGDGISDELERNIIAGNRNQGIQLNPNTNNNTVAGNYIGTDITGTVAIPNALHGIILNYSRVNFIGTNGDGNGDDIEGNLISGNTQSGIVIGGTDAFDNIIAGNFIGTNVTGTGVLPNSENGIRIQSGAHDNRIGTNNDGTSDVLERNIISGNTLDGVIIVDGTTNNNLLVGNYIGWNVDQVALPNGQNGISLDSATITSISDNRIMYHPSTGILMQNGATLGSEFSDNCVVGNVAGFDNQTGVEAIFENNWWGSSIGPSGVGFGGGDSVSVDVDYDPFLTEPPVDCPELLPITIAKKIDPGTVLVGETALATFTFTTLPTNYAPLTNLTFRDELPTDLVTASFSAQVLDQLNYSVSDECGDLAPTDNMTVHGNIIEFSGGTIQPGSVCTVTVLLYSEKAGVYYNNPANITVFRSTELGDMTVNNFPAPYVTFEEIPFATVEGEFINKTVDKSLAAIGESLLYTITFNNPKGINLTSVVISDLVDSRLDVVSANATIGNTIVIGNVIAVEGFELVPGQSATLTIIANISDRATVGEIISNVATLESPNASVHVSNTAETLIIPSALPATGQSPLGTLRLPLLILIGFGVSMITIRRFLKQN